MSKKSLFGVYMLYLTQGPEYGRYYIGVAMTKTSI
jgi:hypothetical protein